MQTSEPKQRRMRKLTDRQRAILKRIRDNGGRDMISPDVATQLMRKGLVEKTDRYQPTSYNRPVKGATLWVVVLTTKGRAYVNEMF